MSQPRMEIIFRIHDGDSLVEVRRDALAGIERLYGLDRFVAGRYSSLFLLNLLHLERIDGVDPWQVVAEIKHLEELAPSQQTKPASQFTRLPLKGLWHKHFMPALPSVMAHNIVNYFGENGLKHLVDEVIDPRKSPVVTKEMIEELSHRVVVESLERRGAAGRLTGEWIVFAKENGQNFYLCVCSHKTGDESIASSIKACAVEFPFLSKYVPTTLIDCVIAPD